MKVVHECESYINLDKFCISFITPADLTGLRTIHVNCTVDDGSGLCIIDSYFWAQWQPLIGQSIPSTMTAKVGSSQILPSQGTILLHVNMEGITTTILFKTMDSKGAFEVLLGKPWLALTQATRDYTDDLLQFRINGQVICIPNRSPKLATLRQAPPNTPHPVHTPQCPTPNLAHNFSKPHNPLLTNKLP